MDTELGRVGEHPIYNHPTHFELLTWGAWARGNQLIRRPQNVLARMIKQASEEMVEVPAPDDPQDFTFDIEVVDKAVARLRQERDRRLRRLVMKYYLGGLDHGRIAHDMWISEDMVRMLHWRAVAAVMRHSFAVAEDLRRRQDSYIKTK